MRRLGLLVAPVLLIATAAPSYADAVTPTPGTHSFVTKDAKVDVLDGPTNARGATIDTRASAPPAAASRCGRRPMIF